jgi:septation ring formation regulator EzrA
MQPSYIGILIGAAVVLNVLLLLGLIIMMPRILSRQEGRSTEEAARLREMLLDVLSEQEAVTLRQAQIGSSISYMHDQIGQIATAEHTATVNLSPEEIAAATGLPQLQKRLETLQGQLGDWFETGVQTTHKQRTADSESWGNLMSLLATMQDRMAALNQAVAVQQAQPSLAADRILEALENEMQSLRTIADEIASLQWKLRRSVIERETNLASLRAQVGTGLKMDHRAA